MARTRPQYPSKYRQQMVELVRAGRTPEGLAREFEPTAASIRKWVKQADLEEGRRHDGMATAEREEIARLRRENRQLRLEREILAHCPGVLREKPQPGSHGRPARHPKRLRVRESKPGHLSCSHDVPPAGSLHQRVLRVAQATAFASFARGRHACREDPLDPSEFERHLWLAAHPRRIDR